jgi:hypothetical protein
MFSFGIAGLRLFHEDSYFALFALQSLQLSYVETLDKLFSPASANGQSANASPFSFHPPSFNF